MLKYLARSMNSDDRGVELPHLLGALGMLSYVAFEGFALYRGQSWEPINYGTGFIAIFTGVGAGMWAQAQQRAVQGPPGPPSGS